MDFLQLLQTIGICVGSIALVAIALMFYVVVNTFLPPLEQEEEEQVLSKEEQALENLRGLSPEQFSKLMNTPITPVDDDPPKRKSSRRKKP